jgi:hypothetical protein
MKQRMAAEFMFYDGGPETVAAAAAYLIAAGYEVETVDWRDNDEDGEPITATRWIIVECMSELGTYEFFDEMCALAEKLAGECIQARPRGEHGIKAEVEEQNRKCREIAAAQAAGSMMYFRQTDGSLDS